jgi:hypothetical protein
VRGHYYRPLDLDSLHRAHPLIGWGASEALERAAPAWSQVLRARDHAARLYQGAQVGAEWFHGIADREKALGQLSSDFGAFARDVAANARARDAKWVASDALPLVAAWQQFEKAERESVAILVATDWETYERWLDKLKAARSNARARDFHLSSPEPVELPETIWDQAKEGTGGELAALLGIGKLAIGAGAALIGAFGLVTLVRDAREKHRRKG